MSNRISVLQLDVLTLEMLEHRLAMADKFHFNYWLIDCTKGVCKGSACPVNYGDEDTEYSQNMGCLPSPFDIIKMRVIDGETWACHSDQTTPCVSGVKLLKALGLPYKVHQIVDEFGKHVKDIT